MVVEARDLSDGWKAKIRNSLSYTFSSKFSRDRADENAVVFTIHGIRTYGEWQERLKNLVETHTDRVTFFNYKYGYFSTIFFLIPALRLLEVRRLQKRILPILETVKGKKVYIFCHSFGTWLATRALKHILKSRTLETELVVVLSGSVLPSNFDWSFVRGNPSVRVINECGTRDYVLWMCNAFAYGLGMAGKCGFNGFNDRRFINRYYDGGHSLYFQSDGFMRSYWLPLIGEAAPGTDIDMRSSGTKVHMLAEGFVRAMGRIKPYAYCLGICLVGYLILRY